MHAHDELNAPALEQSVWRQLRCPDCRGSLAGTARGEGELSCTGCAAIYPVVGGIPSLIGKTSHLNASEVEIQDRVSEQYDSVRYRRASSVRYHEDTMEQLVELVSPHGTVLDDGCGPGAFLEFAHRGGARVERYVGIDVSQGMLAHAKRRLAPSGDSLLLARADACRLPFADATFDVVYARALLHHLPSPQDGIREMCRVLKPGGKAVIFDPNKTLISELPRRLARRTNHFDDDHKNFHAKELEGWVSGEFEISAVRFFGYIAYPLLGFPDLIDFDRLGIGRLAAPLIQLDRALALLPGIRRLGWGVMIAAQKARA